jgi:quinol-cytochrome oxidoreductase complex cytochrome b subunit
LGHPDNYIIANPLSTPTHITPEWYFLPFYAILRSIPSKLFGVSALGFAIISLFFVPVLLFSETRSLSFKPFSQILFWVFFVNCIVLTWIGSLPVKYPFIGIGQILTLYYFIHFFVVGPFVLWFEQALLLMILERNLIILNTGQNIFCLLVFFLKKKNNAEFSTK